MTRSVSFFLSIAIVFFLLGAEVHAGKKNRQHNRTTDAIAPIRAGDLAEARDLTRKAKKLVGEGKYEEALPLAKEALSKIESVRGPEHPGTAKSLMFLGQILEDSFWYYAAIPVYRRALDIREKALGPEQPSTAASMHKLARCYLQLGFYSHALPLARNGLRIREKTLGQDHPETAANMGTLGMLYSEMGSPSQALPLVQRFLEISEKVLGPEAPRTATALHRLAKVYIRMGAYDRALPLAERSVKISEKVWGLEDVQTASALKDLGFLYVNLKEYDKAESCFRRAKHQQGERGMVELYLAMERYESALSQLASIAPKPQSRPQYVAQYHIQRGLALKGAGKNKEACASFLEAIQAIEDLRARTPGERTNFFEAGMDTPYFRAYRGMVAVLGEMAQRGQSVPPAVKAYGPEPGAVAFYFAEAVKARALLDAIAAGAARVSPEIPPNLAAREKELESSLQSLEERREDVFLPHRGREKDIAVFKAKMGDLQKELQGLVEELRLRVPRYAALRYPQPYKASELPLKQGEVVVEYVLGEKETHLLRVEPGGRTQVFRLPLGQEALEKRLSAFCAPFRQSVLRREDLQRFSLKEAASLYKELLEPALAGLPPEARLIIVPDGVLGAFPFEALVVESGPDWRKSVLVGDRWLVTYSQSAAILALNRHLGASLASRPIFALGDCIYDRNSPRYVAYRAGKGQAGELRHAGPEKAMTMSVTEVGAGELEFPPLPETRETVMELAAMFGVSTRSPQVLLDVLATETGVREAPLSHYRYIFFGTHGFLAEQLNNIQEPVLVMTQVGNKPSDDGFLTFSEVLELKLDADLVTLAACMTGVGQVMHGEGVLNFARAFQQAGARSVMASLWNIPVAESMVFYRVFYQAVKAGKSKLEAMREARREVRAREPHPYFWSGLILHGEG